MAKKISKLLHESESITSQFLEGPAVADDDDDAYDEIDSDYEESSQEEQSNDSEDDSGSEGDGSSSRGSDHSSSTPTPSTPAVMTIPKLKFTWETMMACLEC